MCLKSHCINFHWKSVFSVIRHLYKYCLIIINKIEKTKERRLRIT